MTADVAGHSEAREAALRVALGRHRDALTATLVRIGAAYREGRLTASERDAEIEAANARYGTNCALAEVEAETGWHCWVGVVSLYYARKERSSPPRVVRAPTPEALREEIKFAEARRRRRP